MKKSKIFWGMGLLAISVLLILDALGITLGIPEEIPIWKTILGGAFVFIAIYNLVKLRIWGIFFPLTFLVMLFEKQICLLLKIEDGDIASPWGFLLVALLLTISAALLIPKKKHRIKNRITVNRHNTKQARYIDCNNHICETVENNLALCEIFFTNTQMYDGNGSLSLTNNMGRINIYLPKEWTAVIRIENNLGSVNAPGLSCSEGLKTLVITGENNLGNIKIYRD